MDSAVQHVLEKLPVLTHSDVKKVVDAGRIPYAANTLRYQTHRIAFDHPEAESVIAAAALYVFEKCENELWGVAETAQFIHVLEDVLTALYARPYLNTVQGWNDSVYRLILRPWVTVFGPIIRTA